MRQALRRSIRKTPGSDPLFVFDFTQSIADLRGDLGDVSVNRVSGAWVMDPDDGELKLLRGDRTQYIQYTYEFDNVYWSEDRTTVAATGYSDPDGGNNARLLACDGTADSYHQFYKNDFTMPAAGYVWFTIYAKAETFNFLYFAIKSTRGAEGYFDLANGVVGTISPYGAGGPVIIDSFMEDAGDDWYRCGILVYHNSIAAANTWDVIIKIADADGNTTIAGTHTGEGIYIYNANLTALEGPEAIPGDELVTDGGFAAVSEAEEAAGNTVVGLCYKILEQTDIDYTTAGAPNNNVGTYFNATAIVAIDGPLGNDRLNGVTFDSWSVGANTGPEAVAGALTNKAKFSGTSSSTLHQAILTTGKLYEVTCTTAGRTQGGLRIKIGGVVDRTITTDGTYITYGPCVAGTSIVFQPMDIGGYFDGNIDDASIKEITAPGGYAGGWLLGPAVTCSGATGVVPSNIGITEYGLPFQGGQVVNHCLHPLFIQDADAYWSKTYTGTETATTGIDGGAATGWILVDSDNGDKTFWSQTITIPNDSNTHVVSAYFKKTTGATTFPGIVMLITTGGTAAYASVGIDTNAGTILERTDGITYTPDSSGILSVGDWWYVWISKANPGNGNTELVLAIFPAISASPLSATWADNASGDDAANLPSCTVSHPGVYLDTKYPPLYWIGIPDGDNTSPVGMTGETGSATIGYYNTMSAAFKALYQAGGAATTYIKMKMGFTETVNASATDMGLAAVTDAAASIMYFDKDYFMSFAPGGAAIVAPPAFVYGDVIEFVMIAPCSTGKYRVMYSLNGAAWVIGDEKNYVGAFTIDTYLRWLFGNIYPLWIEKADFYNETMTTAEVEAKYG